MKKCNKCLIIKETTEFFKDKACAGGLYSICKYCKKEATYKWRSTNKDKYNAGAKNWRDNNKDKEYGHEIKRRYGITLVEYDAMLLAQGNKCLLCTYVHDTTNKRGRLYVDHCHTTGKVRGLLCGGCNSALGYFEDDIETLQKAIDYLNKNSDIKV